MRIWSIKSSLWLLNERNGCQYQRTTRSYKFMFCCKHILWRQEGAVKSKTFGIALNYDKEFQPPTDSSYKVNNNETGGKAIRQIYVKYFEWKICYIRRLCFDQTLAYLILIFVSPSVTLNISVDKKKFSKQSQMN